MSKKGFFKIGCDPELFLRCKKTGRYVSAIPFIKGTKHAPQPLPNGGNVQYDNVALEFGTDPAETPEEFVTRIQNVLRDLKEVVPEDYELADVPSGVFDDDQLDHPEACRFGCDPDFNVWEMEENEPPCPADPNFRSCGGHIHVGVTPEYTFLEDLEGKIATVRMMDVFLGIPATILDNSEEAINRRQLYGKAGCFRLTDYGVEYRTLSNFWIKSPTLANLMYFLTRDALQMIVKSKDVELIEDIGSEEIQNIINEGRAEQARQVLDTHIRPHMCSESLELLEMAMENFNNYSIANEWEV